MSACGCIECVFQLSYPSVRIEFSSVGLSIQLIAAIVVTAAVFVVVATAAAAAVVVAFSPSTKPIVSNFRNHVKAMIFLLVLIFSSLRTEIPLPRSRTETSRNRILESSEFSVFQYFRMQLRFQVNDFQMEWICQLDWLNIVKPQNTEMICFGELQRPHF